MEIELKYGCNPHQVPARLTVPEESGFRVLNRQAQLYQYPGCSWCLATCP